MKIVLMGLVGVLSGILSGMGLGGGTILIPILTIFFGVEQTLAQGVNLLVFLPTAIISIILHIKNKLIKWQGILFIIIPAIISSFLFAFFAQTIDEKLLKKVFGVFMILLSFFIIFSQKNNVK